MVQYVPLSFSLSSPVIKARRLPSPGRSSPATVIPTSSELYPPIEGFGWGLRKTTLMWQYHSLPKEPNYSRAVHFHAKHSQQFSTSQHFQTRGTSTQQFPPVQQFHARANFNNQHSHIHAIHAQHSSTSASTPYAHVCAPSITRRPFQLVHYLPQHTPQPPHNIPQQNLYSLQQQPQQTRFVLQPPRLILREPQLREQQQRDSQQQREPQIDPRHQFERQNDEDNRREQLREEHQRRQRESRLDIQHRRRNYE
ncbi:activating signal cointegrator 1 complex subunit 2 homolog [Daphnia pulex]|uniref:activating signal cointegrator 1 complex subunit 2 homolog n=1 Tax=Daphnia pulex TaxID=6669 RepID=UPI001EDE2752|nr:activating signal cointegrator 1 complex subunit 2 homolog [Daphnia pulex]